MTTYTYHITLAFKRSEEGHLIASEAKEYDCADAAAMKAEELATSHAGAVAFSRRIDPALGTCETGRLLRQIGDVPNLGYLLGAPD